MDEASHLAVHLAPAVMTLAAAIGFAAAVVASQVSQWSTMSAQQHQSFDPTSVSLCGVYIAAVLLGALAVRSVTQGRDRRHVGVPSRPAVQCRRL